MKKCLLTIACLTFATSAFAARERTYSTGSTHSSQETYIGRATSGTTANTDTVYLRAKELVLKRGWYDMEDELNDEGFNAKEISRIKKAYHNACKRNAVALAHHEK